jgi:hypothetical protein
LEAEELDNLRETLRIDDDIEAPQIQDLRTIQYDTSYDLSPSMANQDMQYKKFNNN